MVGNAIRMMASAPKSRAGCHFGAAVALCPLLEGFAPEIPDHALDMHTTKGAVASFTSAAMARS